MVAVLVGLGIVAAAAPAQAQSYGGGGYYGQPPPPPRGVYRSGLVFGGSLGLGEIVPTSCDNCDGYGALGLQGHIGGMISPDVAILFDIEGMFHPFEDGSTLSSTTILGAVRGWLGRIVWLQAGLGFGILTASDEAGYTDEQRGGVAGEIAGGIELVQSPSFVLDLQLRISAARYKDDFSGSFGISNVGLFVGFNWY